MSTFNGLVAEFPDIRGMFPALRACKECPSSVSDETRIVLHDHLAGLESLRSPFVYCSAATKEMLLRLERFPCRINYAKGILEARIQRYKHLKTLLKPLPLDTPTTLELEPGNHIRVTLFNANHCPGAVMFLFEGQGKAALYTGDIRSEPWFVNTLVRSPSLIEYSYGFKTIDTIYLDTSFIDDDVEFPPKSDGLRELLEKVARYPADTIFHFQAWTYGYEDVWIALSKLLNSKIHVDEYKMLIYSSLVAKGGSDGTSISTGTARLPQHQQQFHLCPEAAPLVGFIYGNTHHSGCLTTLHDVDTHGERIRLHSCEKGNYCQTVVEQSSRGGVVWIRPITARLPDGQDIAEVGVGGGGDDLEREVELDYLSPSDIESLLDIISLNAVENPQTPSSLATTANDNEASENSKDKEQIRLFLLNAAAAGRKIPLDVGFSNFSDNNETELRAALENIAQKSMPYRQQQLPASTGKSNNQYQQDRPESIGGDNDRERETLPSVITFPYSRHSSYQELCHLVGAFRPRDVWPCTVSPAEWYEKRKYYSN
ncbi:beta-lactamase-like protein [Lasiosphaeria miniovina]|uniref:Protein artemis n=1 Tax=Lasiosphaeria miniovina TaxID=1954250 RepID=A0AA40A5J8_9PEZI|nr:beta-lactamase-like protein [Lasiosphaeria miniovina]KAK0709662.1 beta-lactamase-like protein [Lasiosphaeria miniovina]